MTNTITLIGVETVQSAGRRIGEASERMANVSSNIQLVFEAHQRFLDDWLNRFEIILNSQKS